MEGFGLEIFDSLVFDDLWGQQLKRRNGQELMQPLELDVVDVGERIPVIKDGFDVFDGENGVRRDVSKGERRVNEGNEFRES